MTKRPHRVRINALMQAKVLRALHDGPSSIAELVSMTGGGDTSIRTYLQHMRRERLVRIAGWEKAANGASVIPLFEWAPDKADAPRVRVPSKVRCAQYKARKKLAQLQQAMA